MNKRQIASVVKQVPRGIDWHPDRLTKALASTVPVVPKLNVKILAALKRGAGFDMGSWHDSWGSDKYSCGSTHCRAGWAVALAGEPGIALEGNLGPELAGALITVASCPELRGKVPDFFSSTHDAMADIKRLAKLERARPKKERS
ncbi:MAG: hypothetical protein EPN91_02195 [Salinibacterium sp.]|nr:MAG: hypothetical protein EPN91_02195 [Salinibacterium sp.]